MVCECAEVDKNGCYVREVNLIKSDEKGRRDLNVGLKFQVADVRKPLLAVRAKGPICHTTVCTTITQGQKARGSRAIVFVVGALGTRPKNAQLKALGEEIKGLRVRRFKVLRWNQKRIPVQKLGV